ncbi:helix-turn-helix domain-containing protein [Streptosporangium sp. NPDC000396]|uniref:helix-turn-helix domain-containing protein n=1 Tax=Streptosporangium sp. NPDC000396 TaxID=3366185 RepID=UPI00369AB488
MATELRRLRERAVLSGEEAAERLGWSSSKISRIETSRIGIKVKDLTSLLDLYAVPEGKREALLALARGAGQRGWWDAYSDSLPGEYANYIGLEAEAAAIKSYDGHLVHGLLQTEAYARAVLRVGLMSLVPPGEIERRIEVRMTRQALLTQDAPLRFWTVIDEAVLHRMIGGPDVMREQLTKLKELAELPNVVIQVLPSALGAHTASAGTFAILEFPGMYDLDVVYVETMTSSLYIETEAEVFRYNMAFDQLRAMALGPDESMAMIARVAENL